MLKPKAANENTKQPVKNKIIIGGTILMLAATSAWSQDNMSDNRSSTFDPGALYRGNELSVDAFGTASIGEFTLTHPSNDRVRQNTRLGAGAGINYFITPNIGIGGEAYSENTTGPFVDSASGNLILRLPLGQSGFAPYAFGGGGYQFDMTRLWFGQFGAGMEYRFTPHVGIFLDARAVVPTETRYYGVVRLGLRLAF
jgi:hypothetical protein